jgi:hypothetical protein
MNTPTNHEQLSKQEGGIGTLLQTTNSYQNKWQKYEHSYKGVFIFLPLILRAVSGL